MLNLGREFAIITITYENEISMIKDGKHKTERNQDLDKIVHYFHKMTEKMKDLNEWFDAFGADDDAAENP